jgi:hypothetical protein
MEWPNDSKHANNVDRKRSHLHVQSIQAEKCFVIFKQLLASAKGGAHCSSGSLRQRQLRMQHI